MRSLAPLPLALCLASCAVGPDYEPPEAEFAAAYKSAGFDAAPPEGSWWSLFGDAELARLIGKGEAGNPGARAALARYDAARAVLGLARADAFPSVSGAAYARRQGDSANSNFSVGTYNDYRAALNLSWEIDLWGRIRRSVAAAAAEKDAAGYEVAAALLSLRAEIARAYLSLRYADAEIALLKQTEGLRAEARRLMKVRFDRGASSSIDHDRAVTEHESVRAELASLRADRGRFDDALAALVGADASSFTIGAKAGPPDVPAVPAGVPGDLLRRRPDIAASERRLAAASERIGATIAGYLPRLTLTGAGGVQSLKASDLFDPASQLWNLGPQLSVPMFQGGRGGGDKARAEAEYREALEAYREVLVGAVRDTEDSLGDARHLADAAASRGRAAAAADSVADLARKRYQAGAADYFEVVDAERTALNTRRSALGVDLARSLAATRLIQALGGGWER